MRLLSIILSILLTTAFASAQLTIGNTFHGTAAGNAAGTSVSSAGDVNGDGFDDVIVGSPQDSTAAINAGSATIFSGFDGSILHYLTGGAFGDAFGRSVSGAGDVNGDGFDDVIVGAFGADPGGPQSGSATVFSGADGSVLFSLGGDSGGDYFGWSVSGAGDVNGDGFADVIVGAYLDDPGNIADAGRAFVFAGPTGTLIRTHSGSAVFDYAGYSVGGAGDVNGDGFDDVIVGIYFDDDNGVSSGSAQVFSGVDGSLLHDFDGDSTGDNFGYSVSGAGDVNGDGYDDLIVGANLDDDGGIDAGSARVLSGVDGSILYTFFGDDSNDGFGRSVDGAGDVDGDGFDDLIIGAEFDENSNQGSVRIHSGADGSILYTPGWESRSTTVRASSARRARARRFPCAS